MSRAPASPGRGTAGLGIDRLGRAPGPAPLGAEGRCGAAAEVSPPCAARAERRPNAGQTFSSVIALGRCELCSAGSFGERLPLPPPVFQGACCHLCARNIVDSTCSLVPSPVSSFQPLIFFLAAAFLSVSLVLVGLSSPGCVLPGLAVWVPLVILFPPQKTPFFLGSSGHETCLNITSAFPLLLAASQPFTFVSPHIGKERGFHFAFGRAAFRQLGFLSWHAGYARDSVGGKGS